MPIFTLTLFYICRCRFMNFNQISLKTRLIVLFITIFVVVSGLVFYAEFLTSSASTRAIKNSQIHNDISNALIKTNNILHVLEKEIYEQIISADIELGESILQTHGILLKELLTLTEYSPILVFPNNIRVENKSHTSKLKNIKAKIISDARSLHPFLVQLKNTTVNHFERHPAITLFERLFRPTNQEISTLLNQIVNSNHLTKNERNLKKIHTLSKETRYFWTQYSSYARLFIASRLSVFDKKLENTNQNLKYKNLYWSQFTRTLNKLEQEKNQGNLNPLIVRSINKIKKLLPKHKKFFKQIKNIYLSAKWRKDIILLEDNIQPQLDLIWEDVIFMEKFVRAQLENTIKTSQKSAATTSTIIWASAFIMLLTLLVVYFSFEYNVRAPINKVIKALDEEAQGKSFSKLTGSYAMEFQFLLNAFNGMRKQVHARQHRLETILDNAFEGIIITDEQGKIESFNSAAQLLFDYTEKEILGSNLSLLISKLDYFYSNSNDKAEESTTTNSNNKFEAQGLKKNATTLPLFIKIQDTNLDGKHNFVVSVEDISGRKKLIDNLQHQASHDSLTDLYNRNYFTKELHRVVEQHRRGSENKHGLIYIDLDNFKYINDTMGHIAGDKLIKELAQLLKSRIRKTDILSRIGGDEFAILLYHDHDLRLEYVAECFRELVSNYVFVYEKNIVDITCSLGGAYLTDEVDTKEKLLARADFACHKSKRLGRNQAHIYTSNDDAVLSDMGLDIGWTRRIKDALIHDDFVLACQPICDTQNDTVSYYEILLRMKDTNDEIIMPYAFLSAAERFGLMIKIDAWVLRNSLSLLSAQHKFNPNLKFSINLSANSIDNESTFDFIKNKIEENNINPKNIVFEITETIAIANLSTAKTLLNNIRELGCKTALDDFGVGYSSFAYLADLPVDIVKIDGFFIKDMEHNHLNQIMVRSINDIAHELGKTTVAEFVENENIYKMLKKLNVDYSQGYYLGKPVLVYDKNKSIEVDLSHVS